MFNPTFTEYLYLMSKRAVHYKTLDKKLIINI